MERYGLLDAGYTLHTDVFGRDIAAPPSTPGHFNDALHHYHRAGHPQPHRLTWHDRVLVEIIEDPVAVHAAPQPYETTYHSVLFLQNGGEVRQSHDTLDDAAAWTRRDWGATTWGAPTTGFLVEVRSRCIEEYNAWHRLEDGLIAEAE